MERPTYTIEMSPSKPILGVKLLSANAIVPTKGTPLSAGYDLFTPQDIVFTEPGKVLAPTNISVVLPPGTYGRIAPRSGLANKYCLDVLAGVIDRDYTGDVVVMLYLHEMPKDGSIVILPKGSRIAQLVLEKICEADIQIVEDVPIHETAHTGFGSTGV